MPLGFPSPSENQNFDPIYSGLANILLQSASQTFTANLSAGSPDLTAPANLPIVPGLSIMTPSVAGLVTPGTSVVSYDPTSGALVMSTSAGAAATGASIRTGFRNTDPKLARLLRHWTDVKAQEQPVLYLTTRHEEAERRPGQISKWTLDCLAYIYCTAPNDSTPVAPYLNALVGAVRGVLDTTDPSGPGRAMGLNTLGGLVFDAYINGKIELDEGYLGQQGVAKIPITIIQNGP